MLGGVEVIPINGPILGNEEVEAVRQIVKSGCFTNPSPEGGPKVKEFEKEVKSFVGTKHAIAVNSGTSALHASLIALGVKQGDEVIVPTVTFGATSAAVLMAGANLVFVDIDINTFNIDLRKMREKITDKTKGVIPVHLFGLPVDMDELKEIAEAKSLFVLEDACQSMGAVYKGNQTGSIGDAGCFSFYPGKVATTGEGGAVTTNSDEIAERIRMIRTGGQETVYEYKILGGNFRMPEMEAAIGCVQMKKLPEFLKQRRKNAEIMNEKLGNIDGVALPINNEEFRHNYYLYTVRLEKNRQERDIVIEKLRALDVDARAYYTKPIPYTEFYSKLGYGKERFLASDELSVSTFSIPVCPKVSAEEAERIGDETRKILSG
ncbi:MAG: DegT/DnrJ/EryC1/StrS family aminotransferase [Candidatus Omnitrophica bacterium]|nr:DegT/DnrJ/EryC1/StrS family aminotransferase [Candidatus Omnitrophota bacterium]